MLEADAETGDSDFMSFLTQAPSTDDPGDHQLPLTSDVKLSPMSSPSPCVKSSLPPCVTPLLIISSDTNERTARRRPGNTAMQWKNISGHGLIAKATRETGAVHDLPDERNVGCKSRRRVIEDRGVDEVIH